jgi:hypothetical protein
MGNGEKKGRKRDREYSMTRTQRLGDQSSDSYKQEREEMETPKNETAIRRDRCRVCAHLSVISEIHEGSRVGQILFLLGDTVSTESLFDLTLAIRSVILIDIPNHEHA